jgi:hypothetical protein
LWGEKVMHFDLTSWLSFGVLGGWIGSFLAFRKDERAVQVEQITKEGTKWRESIRALCGDIVEAHVMKSNEKWLSIGADWLRR